MATGILDTTYGSLKPVIPDLNQISNILKAAKDSDSLMLLVHPVWPAMGWWSVIKKFSIHYTNLPTANKTLQDREKSRPGPPAWHMRASVLKFNQSK